MLFQQELRHAIRMYVRRPGLPLAAVTVLALGIGVNLAVLQLANAVLMRPMPRVRNEGGLALIGRTFRSERFQNFSYPDFVDVRAQARSFEQVAAYRLMRYALRADGQTERAVGEVASDNYLRALGTRLHAGRWFQERETDAVVISHRLWERRWNRDPAVLGRSVTLNGVPHTIVGIAEEGFRGSGLLGDGDLWTPLAGMNALDPTFDHVGHRDSTWLYVFGRLKPGVSRAQADSELAAIAVPLRAKHAASFSSMSMRTARYNALHQDLRWDSISTFLAVLTGLTLITVLVVCANAANLLLARTAARRREIAIRLSLGAGRRGVVRQFLIEGWLLAVAGVAGGALVATWAADWLAAMVPPDGGNRVVIDIVWDRALVLYSVALTFATTLLTALPAAWQSAHTNVLGDLKAGEAGVARTRLRAALAVVQLAFCMVLIGAASLAARSAREVRVLAQDVPAARVAVASIDLVASGYTQATGRPFLARLHERLGALPGVEAAALAKLTAFSGSGLVMFGVHGGAVDRERPVFAATNLLSPDYFRTLGLPMLAGREFQAREPQLAAILNEPLAQRLFPDRSPVGQYLEARSERYPRFVIVGVVTDRALDVGREQADEPRVYFASAQFDNHNLDQTIHARASDGLAPGTLHKAIREVVAGLDPQVPVYGQSTLAEVMEDQGMFAQRMMQAVGRYSSTMAIVVAAVGLYGLIAFRIAQRTREFGLRIALGAAPGDVLRHVLGEGLWIGVGGLALGTALTAGLTRVLVGLLYGVKALEPAPLVWAAAVLLLVTGAACVLPAWRAMRIEPGIALRWD